MVAMINNYSGHYQPDRNDLVNAVALLRDSVNHANFVVNYGDFTNPQGVVHNYYFTGQSFLANRPADVSADYPMSLANLRMASFAGLPRGGRGRAAANH